MSEHSIVPRRSWGDRAWAITFACFMLGAVVLAIARAPGLWPPRLPPDAKSGITPQ